MCGWGGLSLARIAHTSRARLSSVVCACALMLRLLRRKRTTRACTFCANVAKGAPGQSRPSPLRQVFRPARPRPCPRYWPRAFSSPLSPGIFHGHPRLPHRCDTFDTSSQTCTRSVHTNQGHIQQEARLSPRPFLPQVLCTGILVFLIFAIGDEHSTVPRDAGPVLVSSLGREQTFKKKFQNKMPTLKAAPADTKMTKKNETVLFDAGPLLVSAPPSRSKRQNERPVCTPPKTPCTHRLLRMATLGPSAQRTLDRAYLVDPFPACLRWERRSPS